MKARARIRVPFLLLPILIACGGSCFGTWEALKQMEFRSADTGKYLFRVTPHKDWVKRPGNCKGELFFVDKGKQKRVWSRYLINNSGPITAYATKSGEYVVTMNEWGWYGAFPVVIYGPDGKLIRMHSLESLGLEGDSDMPECSTVGVEWDENAIVFFGPKEKTLIIRLRWGRILMVKLDSGDVMDEEWYEEYKGWYIKETEWKKLHAFAREHSAKLAVFMLGSKDSRDRQTGAIAVGQMKCRGAIPKLRTLLDDPNAYGFQAGDGPLMTVYYVRKVAKQALEAMGEEVKGVVIEEPAKE